MPLASRKACTAAASSLVALAEKYPEVPCGGKPSCACAWGLLLSGMRKNDPFGCHVRWALGCACPCIHIYIKAADSDPPP